MSHSLTWRILFVTTLFATPFARALNRNEEYEPLAEQTRISRQIERDHDFFMSTLWGHQLTFSNNAESSAEESAKLQEMAAYLEQEKREKRNREAQEAYEKEKRQKEEAAQKWRKEFEAKQAFRSRAWEGDYASAMSLAVDKIEGRDDASPGRADWETALELVDRIKGHGNWPHVWAHSLQVARGYQAGVLTASTYISNTDGPPTAETINLALVDLCERLSKTENYSYEEGQAMANVLSNLHSYADQIPEPGLVAPTAAAIRKIFQLFKVPVPQATEAIIDRAMQRLPGTPIDHYWVQLCPPASPADKGYNNAPLRLDALVDVDQILSATVPEEWSSLVSRPKMWRNDPITLTTVRRLLKMKKTGMLQQQTKHPDAAKVQKMVPLLDYYIDGITVAPGSDEEKQYQRWESNHDVFGDMKNANDAELALADAAEGSYWGLQVANKAVKRLLHEASPDALLRLASRHPDFFRTGLKSLEPEVTIELIHTLAANANTPARFNAALATVQGLSLEAFAYKDDQIVDLLDTLAYRLNLPKEALRIGRLWREATDRKSSISHDRFDAQMKVIRVVDILLSEKPSVENLLEAASNAAEMRSSPAQFKDVKIPFDASAVVLRFTNQLRLLDYRAPVRPKTQYFLDKLEDTRGTDDFANFLTTAFEPALVDLANETPFDSSLRDALVPESALDATAAAVLFRVSRAVPEWYPQTSTFLARENGDVFSLRRRAESATAALLLLKAQRAAKATPDDDITEARKWLQETLAAGSQNPGEDVVGRDLEVGSLLTRALLSTKSAPLDPQGLLSERWLQEVDSLPSIVVRKDIYPVLAAAAAGTGNATLEALARKALERALESGSEAHQEYYEAIAAHLDHFPKILELDGVSKELNKEALETRLRWEFSRLNGFTTSDERGQAEVRRLGAAKAMTLALALEAAGGKRDTHRGALILGDNPDFEWSLARAAARQLPDGLLWLDRLAKGTFPSNAKEWSLVKEGRLW